MLTFLPALILLLLHGPAPMEGRLARPGERADVGAARPSAVQVQALSGRAFLAELLRKFPGATVLAVLADEPAADLRPVPKAAPAVRQAKPGPRCSAPPATTQRDRDGPLSA